MSGVSRLAAQRRDYPGLNLCKHKDEYGTLNRCRACLRADLAKLVKIIAYAQELATTPGKEDIAKALQQILEAK